MEWIARIFIKSESKHPMKIKVDADHYTAGDRKFKILHLQFEDDNNINEQGYDDALAKNEVLLAENSIVELN